MGVAEILATIDREIATLQHAKALLNGSVAPVVKRKPGRPRKLVGVAPKRAAVVAAVTAKPAKKKKRNLSPEGRKAIAEAVKRRWAAQKAAAVAK
jgi:hypothetical protein